MEDRWSRRGFLRASLGATAGVVATRRAVAAEGDPILADSSPVIAEQGGFTATSPVDLQVNGASHTLEVGPDESALDLLRRRLGLTGTKEACGHGSCGACTVLVDGVPTVTCLRPAVALDGRAITTIEGLGDELHPVQRALMAEDGLQCGFCTPGFAVEASAFHDAWRATRGTAEPTRDEVAAALGGHLCRCGAYDGIYRAVQGACAGRFDDPAIVVSARVDGLEKVTGRAKYTVDVQLEGQLEGRVLRASTAGGRLRGLDLAPALAIPGVKAAYALALEGAALRYVGQELAAVAAVDPETAERALLAIVLDIEPGPAVVGMDAALAADAPVVYAKRRDRKGAPAAGEGPVLGAHLNANLRGPTSSDFFCNPGAARAAVEEGRAEGRVAEGTWTTQAQCHSALEPHAAVATWNGKDSLTMHLSSQAVNFIAADLAQHFGLRRADVTVLSPYVGGAFGAKAVLGLEAIIAAELSRQAGAPVRVVLSRSEELAVGGYRPGVRTEFAVAAEADGSLAGMTARLLSDSGVAVGNTTGIMVRLQYDTKAKQIDDYDVITNSPPGKPLRGPGGPPAYFAMEGAVDAMAALRGEDPIALRRRWDPNPQRQRLYTWAEGLPVWQGRGAIGADTGRFRRGVGVSASSWFYFVEGGVQVELRGEADGRVVAATSCQDMGQGSRTLLATGVAGVLGVPPSSIEVHFGDSRDVHGPMSGGSRTTPSLHPTAVAAAEQLRDALVDVARGDLGLTDAVAAEGGVTADGRLVPWSELLAATSGVTVVGRRPRDDGGYFLPISIQSLHVGVGIPGAVIVVEVEVDTWLGRVVPLGVWGGFGAGRILVPALARSQAYGGLIQGLSYALYEERRLDPRTGALLTRGLEDYRIAGLGDIPDMVVHFDEEGFENSPSGGVGLSELVTVGVAAAVGNAVHHATGWRPLELPIRPDRVVAGVRA